LFALRQLAWELRQPRRSAGYSDAVSDEGFDEAEEYVLTKYVDGNEVSCILPDQLGQLILERKRALSN
jgi:hypothetical protein